MILKQIRLSGFRRLRDLTVSFSPGLNVIKGPNEAGKSSLHTALRTILLQKPTTTDRKVKVLRGWGEQTMFRLEMRFSEEGTDYSLRKDFEARTAELEGDGLSLVDPDAIQQRLGDWLGCPGEKSFESTICVKQDELVSLAGQELAERLERVLSGGDVGARTALGKLDKAAKALQVGVGGRALRPGPIKDAQDRLAELAERQALVEEAVERTEAARVTLAAAGESLGQMKEELGAIEAALEKNEKALSLDDEIEEKKKAHASLVRARRLKGEMDGLSSRLTGSGELSRGEAEADLAELRQRVSALSEKRRLLAEQADASRSAARPRLAPLVAGVLLVALGAVGGAAIQSGLFLLAALGLALAVAGLMPLLRVSSASDSAVVALEAEAAADEAEIEGLLRRLDSGSPEEAESKLARVRETRALLSDKTAELRGVTGGLGFEDFEAGMAGLAEEIALKEDVLKGYKPSVMDAVELEKRRRRKDSLQRDIAAKQRERDEAEYFLKNQEVDPEDLARLDEETAQWKDRLQRLEHLLRVYEATVESIEQAERETMVKATEVLQSSIGRVISQITQGRYEKIEVDEQDLRMKAFSSEKADWVNVDEELSQATKEQFYLAARLGLVAELCKGRRPPLFLDDPFVTFDEERRLRTLKLLKELSKENQILLFTCHEGYDALADNVIELGGNRE